jgi:hypothetical protein
MDVQASKCEAEFESDQSILLNMVIDNTKCRQRVKDLNIKLFRELTVRNREKTLEEGKKEDSD